MHLQNSKFVHVSVRAGAHSQGFTIMSKRILSEFRRTFVAQGLSGPEGPRGGFWNSQGFTTTSQVSLGFVGRAWLRGSLEPQGYVAAAQVFEKESSTAPGVQLGAITDRMLVRQAVQSGDIESAIERVNDLNPQARTACRLWTRTLCARS